MKRDPEVLEVTPIKEDSTDYKRVNRVLGRFATSRGSDKTHQNYAVIPADVMDRMDASDLELISSAGISIVDQEQTPPIKYNHMTSNSG